MTPVLGPSTSETASAGELPDIVAAKVVDMIKMIATAANTAAMTSKKTLNEADNFLSWEFMNTSTLSAKILSR